MLVGGNIYKRILLSGGLLVALYAGCRVFVADWFRIPSCSMMPTLQPGDKIVVNKAMMGARIYTDYHFQKDGNELQSVRLRGWRPVKYNDVVVFNRANHQRKIKFVINNVYCKRCVALPGDTLSIVNGVYVNNNYRGVLGVSREQQRLRHTPDTMVAPNCLRAMPKDEHFDWTIRNFGPYYVPRKGDMIRITPRTAILYKVLLEWETGKKLAIDWNRNEVKAGGKKLTWHKFLHDYYFMAGDNVLDSDDSRYKGPVPEEYIIGIATRIIDSKDVETQERRWNRIGKPL